MSWGIYFTLPGADTDATVYAALFDHQEDADLALRIAASRPIDSDLLDLHMNRYAEFYQVKKPAYLFEPAQEWLDRFSEEIAHLKHLIEEGRGKLNATLRQGELFENTSRILRPGE